MKDLLANQRNKTGRLRFISLLFALLLLPLGAWADSYFGINIDTSEDGIWVTDQNAANILGDGTMSYDVTNNILTLNGINLSFTSDYFSDAFIAMVDEDHPTLTVRLVGENTLTLGDKACFFNGWGITFTTDTSNPGTLTINTAGNNNTGENWGGALFIDNPTHEPINATYNNGLGLTQNGNTYTVQVPVSYNITVAGTAVTSANASNVLNDDYSSVSYNASTNTLTLKGVHLNSTNNGISVSSDLNINLVGYSNVGTINVTSGTLNFTTSTTLPGCLKTNITGNSTITYGAGTGLSWDGTMVKSSGTNPYIIYATGYKGDDDEYGNDNGDIVAYNNNGSQVELGNPDVTVVNSQNNASIDYFRVPSVAGDPVSSFLYPIDLEDNTLYTKAYFLFDWGTCTNRDVKVRVREYNSNSSPNSGEFRSNEVSLPSDGGLVEIPLTGTVTSDLILLYFTSTTGEFSFIPISVGFQKTESYGLTVAGIAVTSANASNITGEGIDGGKVSYDAATSTLTLNGTEQYGILSLYTNENNPEPMITCNGDLTIQLIGNNGIYFNGSYSNYAIKNTGNSGTLTITQSGTDVALNITTEKNEGASMGLCDGFTAVNFANGLAYTVRNGSRTISTLDLTSPEFNVNENEISFSLSTGLLYGTSNGAVVAAEYFYKITYANASTEGSGVEHELASDFPSFNLDASQKIAVTDLAGACTIEAYAKLNGATSTANKAKKFGPAESPMRLVYGADPVDLVLAPAIEDGDGIKINGIEANVTYNSTTGKVSSETMGSQGGIVSLSYASETVQTLLLNNYFDMDFDVVPPAPTINLAAGEYLNTHANVTVTSAELTNTTIKYQWDNGDATDYPSEGGIPLQTGTLKAWVVYTAGDTPLASDVSEAAFTVLNPAIAMSVYEGQSNEKRLLLQNESGMSMYYAIDYVSTDLNDVPETLYGQAPELLGPCTVTAYAKSGSVQGTTFTGKLFGFTADAVTTSYASQANAPAIVPDFNGSVTYDYSDWAAYLSVNAQGQITPIKVTEAGNAASVSATFIFSENPSFTVLNAEGPSQAATNYIVDGAFSVTINPLELTVTPDNVTVDAGETIVLTFKYAGFAEGEDKTFLTTEPTATYGNADVTKPGSYTITVSGGEAQNYTFVYETGTLTVKRRLNVSFGENNEWATYCATEDLATPQGLQAYQVTNVSGTTVSTEEVGYIPKNTAVLLKMTNADYVLSASAYTGATSTFDTTNKLEGTTEATSVSEINGNVYVLYNDQFVKATSGTIPALRGYLVVSTTNARALDIVIGDATGFSDVRGQMEDAQETIYNLQGQRVLKAQKGLVIVNGKKVVKK